MNPFSSFLKQSGIQFKIERKGEIISKQRGLMNREPDTKRDYIGFYPNTDVKVCDWIINPANERFYVSDTTTTFFHGNPLEFRAFILTENQYDNNTNSSMQTVFNIGTAYSSVIGSQSVVNFNYNESIQNAREQLEQSTSEDKEELNQILNLLEMIVNNQIPPQKGILSKFTPVIQRNSWITSPITSVLLGWLTSQIG